LTAPCLITGKPDFLPFILSPQIPIAGGLPPSTTAKRQCYLDISRLHVIYMTSNRISATFPSAERQVVMTAIDTIKRAMPFLIHLTAEERKASPRVGNRSRGFMLDCLDAAQQHGDCLPRSFDVEEMYKDVKLMEDLYSVLMALSELHSLVDDTYFAAQSEAYGAALKVYDAAKAHDDMPGMKIVVEQLKQQFARRNKKDSMEPIAEPILTAVS
jgi:hypothetical protein